MQNLAINFRNPWFLFFLVVVAILMTITFFSVSKRFRKNRNRITSMVLHTITLVLLIFVLSGVYFSYELPNEKNEVFILVDKSDTNEFLEADTNKFVQSLINATPEGFKIGIIKFGYDQVYSVPLTSEKKDMYKNYLSSAEPDGSATDITSALNYARSLFTNPSTGKIILVSDGLETDNSALSVIKQIAAEGISVNTAYFGEAPDTDSEVQLIGATVPDYHIAVGDEVSFSVEIQSTISGGAKLTLYDNGVADTAQDITLSKGFQVITIKHTFESALLHTVKFELSIDEDNTTNNNTFCTYLYLDVYDSLLVIERQKGASDCLVEILKEEYKDISVIDINNAETLPESVDALTQYDEVILVDIANADMTEEFVEHLERYVSERGGAVFTVGGKQDDSEESHMYNRKDLYDTLYQEMLPVQAINYTPPLGVIFIIDRSGSMAGDPLLAAKNGAMSCVEGVLTSRDWCGIMALEDDYSEELPLTPMTDIHKIFSAIDKLAAGGGTDYSSSIFRAGQALAACKNIEKRHIVLITDGQPGDKYDEYSAVIDRNYKEFGVTFSFVIIGNHPDNPEELKTAAVKIGHGRYYVSASSEVMQNMRADLSMDDIKEINYEPFQPKIGVYNSVVKDINEEDIPTLSGYYGTKLKSGAKDPITAGYVPIFAHWNYGAGAVGSWMCDLGGDWSKDFVDYENEKSGQKTGQKIIQQAVGALLPTHDIETRDIKVDIKENNYTTDVSIMTQLNSGETLQVEVQATDGTGDTQKWDFSADEAYSRVTFENFNPGVYKITTVKYDADDNEISSTSVYRAFSYSKEYDMFVDINDGKKLMQNLAKAGKGIEVDESGINSLFANSQKVIYKTYDPRIILIILAVVLFLLDIAARKFKFKWLHEIIKERKNKKTKA